MAKCTGVRCPMQYGYKVEECNHTDCPYRTEPITNADRIRAMSDDEFRQWLCDHMNCDYCKWGYTGGCKLDEWLQQPAE